MQFKNVALFAAAAAALPTERQLETPCPGDKFGLIAIHSGSPVQNTGITAAKGNLLIGGKNEATCDTKSDGFATFVVNDGEAYLYSTDNPPQQLYVDRSGMGQGKTGYTTGAQPTPKNGERKGWSISDKGYLVFDGESPKACPAKDGAYSIWFTDLEKPAYQDGCIGVALKAIKSDKPNSCTYSSD
ncbi:hypothetical protein M409DRAFT_19252 [Zasmidium cellare ATCC 36951]|uniref:Cell wall protein PhiA n=1 Tax=Zasmidium cellare ATCC 36951 TaxID=1080233 RepID=A0A6A6CTK8_ZASCE|nr:uncharacterized protein M409DRAFT_19252 [Zasmidium cellare ATCC 36951]KAF2170431.1 hypothetical protein M409DRAFT_19252 [Zasmidium cellare ATCC 36951]